MSTAHKSRMGRPPGQEFPNLLHIRITDEMRDELEAIRASRMERPNITDLAREAFADLIRKERRERAKERA